MAGPEFFQTIMGRQFYDGTLPRIAQALERIATALEKQNEPDDGFCGPESSRPGRDSVDGILERLERIEKFGTAKA
jgi:hypothetical protein